jgi:hypothetical protein
MDENGGWYTLNLFDVPGLDDTGDLGLDLPFGCKLADSHDLGGRQDIATADENL